MTTTVNLEQTNLTKDFSNGKNGKLFPRYTLASLAVVLVKAQNELGQQREVSQACSCWEEAALPVTLGRKCLVRTDASILFSSEKKKAKIPRFLQTSFNRPTSPKPPC